MSWDILIAAQPWTALIAAGALGVLIGVLIRPRPR